MKKTKKKELLVKVILPPVSVGLIEEGLYELTKFLTKTAFKGESQRQGCLGGEFGYGADYENDIFMMHRYCWCEEEDCKWCNGIAPNFLYKPTNCKIFWYKYIGRGTERKGELPEDWLEKCKESVESKQ